MLRKRCALPYPPEAETALATLIAELPADEVLTALLREYRALAVKIGMLEAQIQKFEFKAQCGPQNDLAPVETYPGGLGVTPEFVRKHEPPVGQLRWVKDLKDRFDGDDPGNVAGLPRGCGGLITDDLFLTAGHCLDPTRGGSETPSRNGVPITPGEVARLMQVDFNFQLNGETKEERTPVTYPVIELVEHSLGPHEYAILRLGHGANGPPGADFRPMELARQDIKAKSATLCIIQHPGGGPKCVEAGPMLWNRYGRIAYLDLDTAGLSSGAPIYSKGGLVVGVHTLGGCTKQGGFNSGVSIGAIRAYSQTISQLLATERRVATAGRSERGAP